MRSIAAHSALLAIVLSAAPALSQETFRWNGRVDAGDEVEVVGIAVDIEATAASGNQVQVTATGLEDGARVEVEQHSGGVTFCVIHAGMRRTDGDGRCNVSGRGENRRSRSNSEIEVTVRVPAGVRFAATTVSGEVTATGLTGDVEARSVSGDVTVSTRGMVEAASVSGDVIATMGRLPARGQLEFKTVSGNVDITLPSGADAEVRANTLSGEIASDFQLDMGSHERRSFVRVGQRARGTLGSGGVSLQLETVSGDIRLRRGR